MSVELMLAIPPTIDLCLNYGKELKRLCSSMKNADKVIEEYVLRIDNGWVRVEHQLNFMRRVQDLMEGEHLDVYERTLCVLSEKLKVVTSMLQGLVKMPSDQTGETTGFSYSSHRLKYATQKESLERAIEEFETWQRTADPSWFLLMRITDAQIDSALTEGSLSIANTIPSTVKIRAGLQRGPTTAAMTTGLSLDPQQLRKTDISSIPRCDALLATRVKRPGDVTNFILNKFCSQPQSGYQAGKRDVRDLARKLQHEEPETFGLLACKGFTSEIVDPESESDTKILFTLIFRVPPQYSKPRSLRDLLLDKGNNASPATLNFRLDVAKALANAVGYVHTFGFVHKNVRPESIILFDTDYKPKMPTVFLVGFEYFRKEDGQTQRLGDYVLERNLYRHPTRQGVSPQECYAMQHDIYSLGVCLLEIGFWRSFVNYNDKEGMTWPSSVLAFLSEVKETHVLSYLKTRGKEQLLSLACNNLPQLMGDKYAEVVKTCLTCLDSNNSDFGDPREFEDEDGILVGARYIKKYIRQIGRQCPHWKCGIGDLLVYWRTSNLPPADFDPNLSLLVARTVEVSDEKYRNKHFIPPLGPFWERVRECFHHAARIQPGSSDTAVLVRILNHLDASMGAVSAKYAYGSIPSLYEQCFTVDQFRKPQPAALVYDARVRWSHQHIHWSCCPVRSLNLGQGENNSYT